MASACPISKAAYSMWYGKWLKPLCPPDDVITGLHHTLGIEIALCGTLGSRRTRANGMKVLVLAVRATQYGTSLTTECTRT